MFKKMIRTTMIAVLTALTLTIPAFAMTKDETNAACEQILASMDDCNSSSVMTDVMVSDMDTAKELMKYFWYNYYHGNRMVTAVYSYSGNGPVTIGVECVSGILNDAYQEHEEATAALETIAASFTGSTEAELVEQIYYYVMDHVEYDQESAHVITGRTSSGQWDYVGLYATTYTAVINGLSVCQGYSGMFSALCALNGISCQVIHTGYHAYNIVTMDGVDYVYDTTCDDALGAYCISGKTYPDAYQVVSDFGFAYIYDQGQSY